MIVSGKYFKFISYVTKRTTYHHSSHWTKIFWNFKIFRTFYRDCHRPMDCQWQSSNDFRSLNGPFRMVIKFSYHDFWAHKRSIEMNWLFRNTIISADTWKLITAGIELLKLIKLLFQILSQKWFFRTYFKMWCFQILNFGISFGSRFSTNLFAQKCFGSKLCHLLLLNSSAGMRVFKVKI